MGAINSGLVYPLAKVVTRVPTLVGARTNKEGSGGDQMCPFVKGEDWKTRRCILVSDDRVEEEEEEEAMITPAAEVSGDYTDFAVTFTGNCWTR
ncbi:hypothetical protein FCULG_00005480 [Fusarium culmorum]|uniref:Uncharacterized protein n=1 Tax=Fusarium culmorum TaxID=5516 RepID=A0A2T4GWP3_FUSCU|nr:hypothetical protein FCULG_00005480 [Fusarium culmorum]